MSIPLLHALASVALSLAMVMGATAAEPSAKSRSCAAVADPTERLACYDAASPPAGDARAALVDLEAERIKALRDFGLNKVQMRVREPERMRDVSPDRIEAKVARVSYRGTGERVITLDNGQTWLLTEVTSKGRLQVGDQIVVRTAALGSFMLLTPGRVPLRARRIN